MSYIGTTKIGKMYLGDTEIAKAYLGDDLVFQKNTSPYVSYIRNTTLSSYIDTGIKPDSTTKVIVWARNWNAGGNNLFGADDGSSQTFGIWAPSTNGNAGNIFSRYGAFGSPYSIARGQLANLSHYRKYEFYQGTLKVNNVTIVTNSNSFSGNDYTIHLFGKNNSGNHTSTGCPIDICACKIYKGGVLVRDFTAQDSPSAGLYDAVSQTLFTSPDGNSFTYGTFSKDAYIPLDYVECPGGQSFDAGIRGSNDLDYVSFFEISGSSSWPNLFGAQTSNNSKRYGVSFGDSTNKNTKIYSLYNSETKIYSYGSSMAGKSLCVVKAANVFYLYENGTQKTSQTHTSATFTTDYNIYVAAQNNAGTRSYGFYGKLLYMRFGIQRNYVPAKVNNVAGMYDTYNDTFKPSDTETSFIAGNEL